LSFGARFASPSREELLDLARKYDVLADLRKRREEGGGVAPRAELLALAREFPGALRELDTLPRAEIERRSAALRATLLGDPPAPWMTWLIAYHATMRAALFIKGRLARSGGRATELCPPATAGDEARSPLASELALEIARDAERHWAIPIDESFVQAVARPPARRVNAAVFERLGRELGVPADEMWQALFPSRRATRF
jgi:hypothetical protein